MKKLFAYLLVLVLAIGLFAGCSKTDDGATTAPSGTVAPSESVTPPEDNTVRTAMCQACEEEVEWTAWTSTDALPAVAGHYYLENDVTTTSTTVYSEPAVLCLDLNGKTVKQGTEGCRVYYIKGGCIFSLMDSVGGGTIIPANGLKEGGESPWGQAFAISGTNTVVNMYGGTIDASQVNAQYGCCVNINAGNIFNMYGGKMIGGTTWGSGSGCITVQGTFTMDGGELVGGHAAGESTRGGGCIGISDKGVMYMNGGSITNGVSDTTGGVIRCAGTLYYSAGTISGGTAAGAGQNIYVHQTGSLNYGQNAPVLEGVDYEVPPAA